MFQDTDTMLVVIENPTPEQREKLVKFYKLVIKDTTDSIFDKINNIPIEDNDPKLVSFKENILKAILEGNSEQN
jgi:hypothetical protein